VTRRRRVVFILLTVFLSLAVVFSVCEVLVRLFVPREVFWPIGNIYRPVTVPAVGYTFRPNFRGTAFGVDLVTNAQGYRGPDWTETKAPGTFRVALLGDSHAFGYGVPFEDTVGEVLARALSKRRGTPCEVLNFGAPGYNAQRYLEVWQRCAAGYRPDVVVVLLCANDHDPVLWVCRDGWLHHGPMPEMRVMDESLPRVLPRPLPGLVQNSRLVQFLLHAYRKHRLGREAHRVRDPDGAIDPQANWRGPIEAGPVPPELRDRVYAPLRALARDARARGAAVVVAALVDWPGYRSLLGRMVAEDDVHVLDLLSLFPEARSDKELKARFSLGWDAHFNGPAHRRWGEALAEKTAEVISNQ
jgi:lysophospholipase L1-like esterase